MLQLELDGLAYGFGIELGTAQVELERQRGARCCGRRSLRAGSRRQAEHSEKQAGGERMGPHRSISKWQV